MRVKINGAASVALPQAVANSDSLKLVLSSVAGISVVEWHIFAYPDGFDPGNDWELVSDEWVSYGLLGSSDIDMPASGNDTWLFKAYCKDNSNAELYQVSGGVYILSDNGLRKPAYLEQDEIETGRHWLESIRDTIDALDAQATAQRVDDYKSSVRCATTANITLSGSQTIDGITPSTGNRVLVKDQSTAANNGIYVYNASGAWTRATDADADAEVTSGMVVYVEQGTTNGKKLFKLETANPIVVGMTSLTFTEISGSGGSLPQPLDTTDSPTFAGLTLTSFSGFLKATAGVLSAAALALSDLPTGSAGTVLTGTGGASAYSATPVLTAVRDSATTAATTGLVRGSNATTLVAARNAANDANWSVLSTDENGIIVGAATGPSIALKTATTVTFGAASPWVSIDELGLTLEGNDGTALYGGDYLGSPYKMIYGVDDVVKIGTSAVQGAEITVSSGIVAALSGTGGFYITPAANILVTAYADSSSITYGWQDKTANSATGSATNMLGQNCTGTNSIGGAVNVLTGSGTSANGELNLGTGGVTRLTLSSAGKILYFAASLTTAVSLTQADLSTNSATGARLDVLAQTCTGATSIGGELRLGSGAGTSRDGFITFYRGTTQRGQIGFGTTGNKGIWFGRSNTASGNDSTALGVSNTTSNDFSVAIGYSNMSSGSVSVALGGSNTSSSDYSTCLGYNNVSNVANAVSMGSTNTSSGNGSIAGGLANTAANTAAIAFGYAAYASGYAEFAHASGAAPGSPQNSFMQISGTTSATASTNVNLKAGPSANQEVITRTGRIYAVEIIFVATGPSFSPVGRIRLTDALIKNDSGTVSVIDAGTQTASTTTPVDWTITLSGSGNYLRVNFAKTADATALRCSASVRLVDVAKA